MVWLLDLDGVLWRGDEAIPGSADAVARIRAVGIGVAFLTNNSSQPVGVYEAKLERMGVPVAPGEVLTSAMAAVSLLQPGETALVCGGPGVDEAISARGVHGVRTLAGARSSGRAVDAVVVGWHRDFDYDRLDAAFQAVIAGARLIGTNDDATYPMAGGHLLPGGGSLLAAVAYASGATPIVAGKPHDATVALVHERLGAIDVMVGDRPDTDGLLARRLGARFVQVRSGVTPSGDPSEADADVIADDLASAVSAILT